MDGGKIDGCGTPRAVIKKENATYKEIYESQTERR